MSWKTVQRYDYVGGGAFGRKLHDQRGFRVLVVKKMYVSVWCGQAKDAMAGCLNNLFCIAGDASPKAQGLSEGKWIKIPAENGVAYSNRESAQYCSDEISSGVRSVKRRCFVQKNSDCINDPASATQCPDVGKSSCIGKFRMLSSCRLTNA